MISMEKRDSRKRLKVTDSEGKDITVDAEIADSFFSKMKGLMGRRSLGENEGMLFIFERAERHSFWMFNTKIPLDAIFFDEDGKAVDIITMEPCKSPVGFDCPNYRPVAPAKYVLEVNKGFAKKNKLTIGSSSIRDLPS